MNLLKLMLFSVIFILCLFIPILTPIALIASVSFFKSFLEKGEADLFETLRGIDMTADRYLRLLITSLLQMVVVAAGFFLFFIPGIYFAFALAPLFYLITLNPEITTSEAFKQSFEVMNGNKINLFLLRLLGLLVPMILSLVIAIIGRFLPVIGGLFGFIYMLITPLIFAEIMIVDMMFFREITSPKKIDEEPHKVVKLPKAIEIDKEPNEEETNPTAK
ncbi:DUF975 family protein [Acholeplasma vituli]|uniref:DUF975 family protein n=1 Tax=Paracholeplasma vituli TaxID=69473 RepID=A0ABT2PVE8_9MOLU|nr:DUF975 family protein [Paracholeplasma vituli]MCU0104907.1 DUF975 family protein [Paracholeplasma vituli]